jgi:hypothetical protein
MPDYFWTRKLLNKHHVLTTEQLGTTVASLEYMPQKILKQLWKGYVVTIVIMVYDQHIHIFLSLVTYLCSNLKDTVYRINLCMEGELKNNINK